MKNTSFKSLNKLTIIIPTYERQKFVLRCMKFWSGKGVTLIVLDGSKKRLDSRTVGKFKKNIKYFHNTASYYKRLLSAIKLIKTEYVLLGCDDEFYIPSALNSCIIKILKQTKLVACCGRAIGFNYQNNSVLGKDVYPRLNENLNLFEENPNKRIKKHFLNYEQAHTYAVCRSDIWKIAAKTIFSKEYNCYSIHELQFEFFLCFSGRSLVIPELMWLRSNENKEIRDLSPSLKRSNSILNWWSIKKHKTEKTNFILRAEETCNKLNKITKKKYIPDIENSINYYLEFCKRKKDSFFYIFLINILRYLPVRIKDLIKETLKNIDYRFNKKLLLKDVAKSFKLTGIKVDFEELNKIERIISLFHQK
jgi:glycosyltransferase domain-containing protein